MRVPGEQVDNPIKKPWPALTSPTRWDRKGEQNVHLTSGVNGTSMNQGLSRGIEKVTVKKADNPPLKLLWPLVIERDMVKGWFKPDLFWLTCRIVKELPT